MWQKVLEKQKKIDRFIESVVPWCHMRWQGSKLFPLLQSQRALYQPYHGQVLPQP